MRKVRNTGGSSGYDASSYSFSASCKIFSHASLKESFSRLKKVFQVDESEDEEDEHAEELNKIHEQNIQLRFE